MHQPCWPPWTCLQLCVYEGDLAGDLGADEADPALTHRQARAVKVGQGTRSRFSATAPGLFSVAPAKVGLPPYGGYS